jgi:hypothetical protein
MAEEEGFEPSVQVYSHGLLATPCINLNISINKVSYNKKFRKTQFSVENNTYFILYEKILFIAY